MSALKTAAVVSATFVLFSLSGGSRAQYIYSLPQNDFTWVWGNLDRGRVAHPDIDVDGNDGGFRCSLTAALSFSSRLSSQEVRQLENELRTSLQFVGAASQAMNALDAQRELQWAKLECKSSEPTVLTEEQKLERESKARDRMQREIERRRARQQGQSGSR